MKKTNKYRKKTSNDQDQTLGSEGGGEGERGRERERVTAIDSRKRMPTTS